MMEIVIKIPEKEFGIDIEDKFQDFFKRLEVEAKDHMICGTNLLCGAYELETIQMFMQALANGTPLPKGHGRLIDADAFGKELHRYTEAPYQYALKVFNDAPTIIEAESEDKE
jgi:hypothetical protein